VLVRSAKNLMAVALMALSLGLSVAVPAKAEDEGRHVKSRVAPQYPELAKRMNVTGVVKVRVTIEPNGNVKEAKVVGGHPLLVDPAVEAARKWKYEPGPNETTEIVEFRFDNNNNN
jgi:TonB family protein